MSRESPRNFEGTMLVRQSANPWLSTSLVAPFVVPKHDRIASEKKKKQTVHSRRTEASLFSKKWLVRITNCSESFAWPATKVYWLNRIDRAEKHGCFPMKIVDTGVWPLLFEKKKRKKRKTVPAFNKMRKYGRGAAILKRKFVSRGKWKHRFI